jgi:protoheme IX farnesyltransferase
VAAIGGALFIGLALQLRRDGAFPRRPAHRLFAFSILYLFALFAALLVDAAGKAPAVVSAWASIVVSATGT